MKCELNKFIVPSVSFNAVSSDKSEHRLHMESNVTIMVPKAGIDHDHLVEIKLNISDNDNEIFCKIKIIGFFTVSLTTDEQPSRYDPESVSDLLKNDAYPVLYKKLSNVMEKMGDLTGTDFFSIPPFDETCN